MTPKTGERHDPQLEKAVACDGFAQKIRFRDKASGFPLHTAGQAVRRATQRAEKEKSKAVNMVGPSEEAHFL